MNFIDYKISVPVLVGPADPEDKSGFCESELTFIKFENDKQSLSIIHDKMEISITREQFLKIYHFLTS